MVLVLVLYLFPDAFKDSDCSGIVVDPSRGSEGCLDDLGRGDEVVGETVVETPLKFEEVLYGREELDVTRGKGVEGFIVVGMGSVGSDCRGRRERERETRMDG